ncbi:MAG: DUF2298 domain-containing protein, partial [Nitrospiria bacterium]
FVALYLLSYVRSFAPDIHGLEKYMDFGMINSILRSPYFPPRDMWFTPLPMNYYYFGHLITAVLIRISNIPANIGFNLMLGTIFGMCTTISFSLGYNFFAVNHKKVSQAKLLLAGLLSLFLVSIGGNLHPIYTLFSGYNTDLPKPPWQMTFAPQTFPNAYWYPNATRFIYHTIHEFPIYSWTVSDLHGHVLDIPLVLLTLSFIFVMYLRRTESERIEVRSKKQVSFATRWDKYIPFTIFETLSFGLLLAVMYMTNALDGVIYFLLAGILMLFFKHQEIKHAYRNIIDYLIDLFASVISGSFVLGILFILFSLPFSLFFKPFASGIGILCAPKALTRIGKIGPLLFETNHCQHSPWWQLLILYGFFYFFVIAFLIFLKKTNARLRSDGFILILILVSTLLIIIPELVYVKDIYPEHYRANTMFKLVFQAFMMLALSSAYIFVRIVSGIKNKELRISHKLLYSLFIILSSIIFIPVAIYPYFAITSYYGNLQVEKGLDGTKYLQTLYPTDYAAINWLNKNIPGQPVILEVQGDSYTDYARVSANTGLPTVLGWTVHEWLWRGSYDVPAPRIPEVQDMYTSPDMNRVKQLLQKYQVQYIFVGDMEYQKYPTLDVTRFDKFGKVVYQSGRTRIYKVGM